MLSVLQNLIELLTNFDEWLIFNTVILNKNFSFWFENNALAIMIRRPSAYVNNF